MFARAIHLHRVGRHSQEAALHATAVLRDGTLAHLRAIRPDDKERLRIAFERLSPRSVYRRFFHPVTALTPAMLRQLTELDVRKHVGLVLSVEDNAGERLIAVARFVRDPSCNERAELAITVADDYQNRGAATLLLQQLVRIARNGGVRELLAEVLEDNPEMLELIRRSKLPCRQTSEDGVCRVVVSLREPPGGLIRHRDEVRLPDLQVLGAQLPATRANLRDGIDAFFDGISAQRVQGCARA